MKRPLNLKAGQRFNPFQVFHGSFIPEGVSRYRGISPGAKLVYSRLCRYAGKNGEAFPAVKTIGEECGIGESQARAYLQELVGAAFLQVIENKGRVSNFHFLWHPAFHGEVGETKRKFHARRPSPPVQLSEGVPVQLSEPPTRPVTRTRRESSSRESGKESQAASPASLSAVPTASSSKATPKPSSKDDDEKTKSKPSRDGEKDSLLQGLRDAPKPSTDHEARELTSKLMALGKEQDVENALRKVGKQLQEQDGIWIEYWEKAKQTGNPKIVAGGHYVALAKGLLQGIETARMERSLRHTVLMTPAEPKRTHVCKSGKGCTDGRLTDGTYCSCPVGQLAQHVYGDRLPPASEAPKAYDMAGAAA